MARTLSDHSIRSNLRASTCVWQCEWVWFAGEGGECSGDFVDAGSDVCCCGANGSVGVDVAGVGTGDGVAEVALDPGEGGVAEPVDGDLLGSYPGQVSAEPCPEVVVAASGERSSVAVAEKSSSV